MTDPQIPSSVELLVAITRLEEKVDNLSKVFPEKVEDHEKRIRAVEKKIWSIPSIAVVVAIAALVVSIFALPQLNHNNTPQPTSASQSK